MSQFQTFKFFQEIIEEQRHYRDSALQAYFSDSKRYSARPGMRGEKASQPLSSDAEFEKYYLRCLRLVDSNQRRGVMDLRSSEGERFRAQDAFDDNINVVIDGEGRIVHCRLGKHRLALRDCFVWIASGCGVGLSSYAPRERR